MKLFQEMGWLKAALYFVLFPFYMAVNAIQGAISHWRSARVKVANDLPKDDFIELAVAEIADADNGAEPTMSRQSRKERDKKIVSKRRHGLYKRWGGSVPYYVRCAA